MRRLTVCADPFPPYQFINANGEIDGSDYHLIKDAFDSMGYETEFIIEPWNEIYKAFEKGDMDVLFQAQDSPERLKKFYMSDILRNADTDVITLNPALTEFTHYEQLINFKIGVISGFNNGEEIDGLPAACKRGYQDTKAMLIALLAGEVDAIVGDSGVTEYIVRKEALIQNDDIELLHIKRLRYSRPLYVMFNDREVRDGFNEAMKEQNRNKR